MIGISTMRRNKAIFVDTSAHYALLNSQDIDHREAVNFLKDMAKARVAIVCSNFIISETYTFVSLIILTDQ